MILIGPGYFSSYTKDYIERELAINPSKKTSEIRRGLRESILSKYDASFKQKVELKRMDGSRPWRDY